MIRRVLLLSLMGFVGTAQATVPAPLVGIWALERPVPAPGPNGSAPTVELSIGGGSLRGTYGCAKLTGTLSARSNVVRFDARVAPPAPNERCVYAGDLAFVRELNAATRFVATRDRLVLMSGTSRLTFRRVGFVTPVRN